jgi:hypothetical protein
MAKTDLNHEPVFLGIMTDSDGWTATDPVPPTQGVRIGIDQGKPSPLRNRGRARRRFAIAWGRVPRSFGQRGASCDPHPR